MVPPRAKHCLLCECCILKRDHHCFFAGCCIGFHNQRYFTVFCFYGCLGSIYSLYTIYIYLDKYYTPLFSLDFYGYLLPWLLWRWFWGAAHHSIIWLTVLLYMSCASSFACTYFFAWQIYLVFTGQTTYEFLKKDKTFKRPLLENLKSTFGNLSLLNFVCPLPFFKNHGNGIEWRTTCGLEEKIC
ncbi:hypothetical protein LOTGIDRAFT_138052 [Lottia gigantea]|uniref:Palmitoyltransferase n=1 Tax=Lottia gigantea TaxID=225164 RepID=V4CK80_LOTGI|nr:hypothetical protein LOTGIDRAFT_138052 [Lottia gigantea]ESP02640.1 hypothetical protein LOTGIDRAFT_138052 [Lottia gigantea]